MSAIHTTFFITASDTGVGKTHVTANLLRLLLKQGYDARAIKPIETGFDYRNCQSIGVPVGSDVDAYQQVNPSNVYPPAYYFNVPASPHYSARLANASVDIDQLEDYCQHHMAQAEITLIEGAGGLLVPFDEHRQHNTNTNTNTNQANHNSHNTHNFTHLIKRLNCPIILVINNQLGAINQALVNIQLCQFHGIDIACVVMNQTDPNDSLALENIAFVQGQTNAPVVQVDKDGSFEQFERAFNALDLYSSSSDISFASSAITTALEFDKTHLWHPYTSMSEPVTAYHVRYAQGKYIYINDGKIHTSSQPSNQTNTQPSNQLNNQPNNQHKLLDAMSSWWAVNLGYNRDDLNQSAIRQINQFSHVMFGGLTHDPAIELGKTLVEMLPDGLEKIFYTDSGSVSVEVAIKMALQYQQATFSASAQTGLKTTKTKILTPMGGYHGDTFGAMSVCDPVNGMHGLFRGMLAEQIFIPRPDCVYDVFTKHQPFNPESLAPINQAIAQHQGEIAAIIIEPMVQGAGGMRFYHPQYLRHLRKICDKQDIVLIFDEIATGFGRTGAMFASTLASQLLGEAVTPDIICLGKALTAGFMSFACTVTSQRIAEGISQSDAHGHANPFMHGPTFMGNPLACAVAKTALDGLRYSDWQTQVANIEQWLAEGLAPCRQRSAVADVRVLGAIGVVEMHKPVDVAKIQAYFISQGVWIRPFGKLVYTMPHFNFNQQDVAKICQAIISAIDAGEF